MATRKKPGFIKIRDYIVNKITVAGDRPVTFPTARELGAMFNVTHPTVLRALKGLIEDGYLESCPSGGTVSRPQKNNPRRKIFGCLTRLGTQVFEERYSFDLSNALLGELFQRDDSFYVHRVQIEDPNHLQKAVLSASLSGLLLISPEGRISEYAEKLRRDGFPVVSIGGNSLCPNDFSGAHIDTREYVRDNLSRLFEEGRRRISLVAVDHCATEVDIAVKEACKQAGVSTDCVYTVCAPSGKHMELLTSLLENRNDFDGALFQHTPAGAYRLIAEKMDVIKQCRVVMGTFGVFDNMNYTGYVSVFDLKRAAKTLIDNFLDQLKRPDAPIISEVVPYKTVYYQDGKLC